MAKSRSGGRRGNTSPTPASGSGSTTAPRNYTSMTDADASQLRQIQDSAYNGSVTSAIKMYISGQPNTPASNVDGKGHSLSQSMNYLLEQGIDLQTTDVNSINKQFGLSLSGKAFASMQYMDSYLQAGAHALGKDTNLVRFAHSDVLKDHFSISNYNSMSESQLQSALVGKTWTSEAYFSTSYDASKSPFNAGSSSGVGGGREVVYNIKASASTKVLMGAKAQAEIIINKGTQYKITGVHYSGKTASPRGKGIMNQIVIDVEVQ